MKSGEPWPCVSSEPILDLSAGAADVFIAHPEGEGRWPVILFYMDAPGIRAELHDMARRLASHGHLVVLPNLFYRNGVNLRLTPEANVAGSEEQNRMFTLMNSLSVDAVMADTAALLGQLSSVPSADLGRIGALGFCMSGRFAMAALHRFPGQVRAAASIYGTELITGQPDSPHFLAAQASGRLYVAIAENDIYAPAAQAEPMRAEFQKGTVDADVEVLPGVDHGFCFPERATYDRAAAEHVWEKLFRLFGSAL